MNGLALHRAAMAAQAQAASTNNPTPVHSEDLQPNEALRKRKGVGLPPVVAATALAGRSGVLSQTARRGCSHKQRRGGGGHGQHEAGRTAQANERTTALDSGQCHRRPRPIPLPPPSSARLAHESASTLPALKSTPATTSMPRPVEPAAADRSRSPKRRKIDLKAEIARLASYTVTSTFSQPHATVKVKSEPESPPLPSVERKAVSSQLQFFPFPDDCKKLESDWLARRINFKKEAERELRAKGFEVGKYLVRGDGISIEWQSPVPVWNDTLEPVSHPLLAATQSNSTVPPAESTPLVSQSEEDDPPATSTFPVIPPPIPASHDKPDAQLIPPSPVPTTSASPKPNPKQPRPPVASVSPANIPALASTQPTTPSTLSPSKRRRKPRTEYVSCGRLDLATAIRLSQRDNASPRSPPRRQTVSSSARSTRSPAVKRLPSLSPSLSKSKLAAYDVPTKASPPPRTVLSPGLAHETRVAKDEGEVEVVHVSGGEEGRDVGVGEASGWTVIQMADPDRTEEVVEEEHDQLVEDEEDELRDEMEAAGAVRICCTKDESGDEREEVENAAILDGAVPSPVMTEIALPQKVVLVADETTADTDVHVHDLSRVFLTKYMLIYETNRAQLISAYAPDARLIYRVSEPPPAAGATRARTTDFPLRSARGHDEISTFLHGLGWTHFARKLDEDGNREVDVEFRSERLDEGIWLYVRSVVTMEDEGSSESGQANRWSADHSFLLRRAASESAMGDKTSTEAEDAWPLIAHVHQFVMHESTL